MRKHWLLIPVLLGYLLLGTLYAVYTPDWQAPDEPAHYNYVRQLADGDFPLMEPGDYDQTYIETIVGSRFDPALPVAPITYEDWQPPLYYLLQTPGYLATDGSLTALRLLSVLFGAGVVVLAYAIGLTLFPDRPWIGLGAAVFVAFLPQHLAMMASVNNDSLAELFIAGMLLLLVRPWPDDAPPREMAGRLLGLGLLLGAAFLTKGTAYLMAPVIGLVLLYRYWGRWRSLLEAGLLVFGPALLLGSIWWLRNAAVYGDFDILIRQTHDEVVVGQPRTADWIAQFGLGETVERFFTTTFNSFWGQFGWMAAPLPGWAYTGLRLLSLAALAGLVVAGLAWWQRRRGGARLAGAGHGPVADRPAEHDDADGRAACGLQPDLRPAPGPLPLPGADSDWAGLVAGLGRLAGPAGAPLAECGLSGPRRAGAGAGAAGAVLAVPGDCAVFGVSVGRMD